MGTRPDQIDAWLQTPKELRQLEFKAAKTQYDTEKLFGYCVAIANEGGGHLVLGITDDSPRRVCGTRAYRDPESMASKVYNTLGFRVQFEEVQHPDGRVLVLHIPSRPQGTAYQLRGAYLMRVGEELHPMSEDQLRRIFDEGKPDWLEQTARSECNASDIVDLLDTQRFFELLGTPYPTQQTGVVDALLAERLLTPDVAGYTISNLAALLLAKSLGNFETVKRKAIRVIVYRGNNKLQTVSDQLWDTGYAVGFQSAVRFVMDKLPQNEIIADALRVESKLLPDIVIRELVANALIHQDFTLTGMAVSVEVYDNRIEITNPGTPMVEVERFIDGYRSRNEHLANLMRRFRICEEKGSGIDRTIDAAETHQLPAPDFREAHQRTSVTVFGPRDFKDMDRDDRIRACYQHCALQWVQQQHMTNQSLRVRFYLADNAANTVSRIITDTTAAGLIKADTTIPLSRKYARYLPVWA